MTVRILPSWSCFYGWLGRVVAVGDDYAMIRFPGDPRALRFGLGTFEAVE